MRKFILLVYSGTTKPNALKSTAKKKHNRHAVVTVPTAREVLSKLFRPIFFLVVLDELKISLTLFILTCGYGNTIDSAFLL